MGFISPKRLNGAGGCGGACGGDCACGGSCSGKRARGAAKTRALGLSQAGEIFQVGPNQGCVEGTHPVGIVGADHLWMCQPDGGDTTISVEMGNQLLTCPVGYLPQEIPTGSGNWVCVAGIEATSSTGGNVADTFTPLVDASAPRTVAPTASANPQGNPQENDAVLPSDEIILKSIEEVASHGGDVSRPTAIVDASTGSAVAVVKQLADGTVHASPAAAHDLGGIVNSVTGFIDHLAGTISDVQTQVKKVGHAIQGAATGAQAGYDAPTDWRSVAIGAGVLVGGGALLYALTRPHRRHG